MRDDKQRTNEQQLKIELLSQWKLEAESRKNEIVLHDPYSDARCLPNLT